MQTTKQHFHTFDALRFLAFLLVFLAHVPIENLPFGAFLKQHGHTGVAFFFVLSGFLITYLLLHEKETTGVIHLTNFFARRALRIWPLYYAMVLFAFLTPFILQILRLPYSDEGFTPNWLLSCLFLENYEMMWQHAMPNVSPMVVIWTLCIEEHFYLLWGLLFFIVPIQRVPWVIAAALLLAPCCRVVYGYVGIEHLDVFTNIDLFAYGALPAWCLVKKNGWLALMEKMPDYTKYALFTLTVVYVALLPLIDFPAKNILENVGLGVFFSFVVFCTLPPGNRLFIGNNNVMSRLGKYTYSLYLFHTIVVNLFLQLFKLWQWDIGLPLYATLLVLLAFGLSVLLSMVSYHWFESPFLRLKNRFR